MIVALAAWLYIINALLGLISLRYGGGSTVGTLLMSGLCGAMGYGLLKREAWARWLALGVSLLSWVFGTLFFIFLLGALATSGKAGAFIGMMFSGAFAILSVILVIALLIMLVSIVISFKLFFHLCSEEGCEEFGVPYGSAGTVVASVGAWVAIAFGQVVLSSGGSSSGLMLAALQGMSHDQRDEWSPEARRQRRLESERRESELRAEEQRRHAEQEARLRQIREAENQQALDAAAASDTSVARESGTPAAESSEAPPVEEAPVPVIDDKPVEEEKTSGSTILKCRDASGSVMFTQGYCPPGTKRVDMPKSE